jgi:SOS-response transcriptional repressor LexA
MSDIVVSFVGRDIRRVTALGESQIYRDLLRFKPEGLSANAWAVKAGVSRTVWTDMRRHGNPSRRTLEKLLAAADSSLAEFEALRLGPHARQPLESAALGKLGEVRWGWTPAALPPLPLIAASLAGEWGEPGSQIELTEIHPGELVGRVPRPISLAADPDAYALTVVGDSMWPRFRPGRQIAISPRSPVAIGDDVLARLLPKSGVGPSGTERVLIKQLVKRASTMFELRQFNPDLIICIDTGEVEAIVKVVGELI